MRLERLYNCPPQWSQERDCGSTLVRPSKCHVRYLGCQWLDFNKTLLGWTGWRLSLLHCGILQITLMSQSGAVQQLHDIHTDIMHNISDGIGHIVPKGKAVLHLLTPSVQLPTLLLLQHHSSLCMMINQSCVKKQCITYKTSDTNWWIARRIRNAEMNEQIYTYIKCNKKKNHGHIIHTDLNKWYRCHRI